MHDAAGGLELILKGGFMMYPLLISAVIALTVILERLYTFHLKFKAPLDLVSKSLEQAAAGDSDTAEKNSAQYTSPLAAVLTTGLRNFRVPKEQMELAMKNEAERWLPLLEKRVDIVDTVITAAPLMGLLGTITGMMNSFQVLSAKGVNEPNAITGGVAEALIATATGLIVALFCLVAYNYLTSLVKHYIYELESVASRLIEARLVSESGKRVK